MHIYLARSICVFMQIFRSVCVDRMFVIVPIFGHVWPLIRTGAINQNTRSDEPTTQPPLLAQHEVPSSFRI